METKYKYVRCTDCGLKRKSKGHDDGEHHIRRKASKATQKARTQ